jgi:hypothetical protein
MPIALTRQRAPAPPSLTIRSPLLRSGPAFAGFSDDRVTVRNKPPLLGLTRGLGLRLFLLDILYSARRQTASNMNPSGPSQNTA